MPNIGDIARASDIGHSGRAKYVFFTCPDCGTPRWMYLSHKGALCQSCATKQRARKTAPVTFDGIMPKLGDTALSKSLGYSENGLRYYDACPKCGTARWLRRPDRGSFCVKCTPKPSRDEHARWKPSRIRRGYVQVHIDETDPMYPMSRNGGILEHRLVAARKIGRCLLSTEVVHHINGNKSDNRPSNLMVLSDRDHSPCLTVKDVQYHIRDLELRVIQLEAENALLSKQLSGVLDGVPVHHNTLAISPDKAVEGIVQ